MDRDSAVTLLKARLKRSNDSTIGASIITEMQFVQQYLLERGPVKPWFLLTDWVALATVQDDEKVSLPTGFILEHEESNIEFKDTDDIYYKVTKNLSGTIGDFYKDDTGGYFPSSGFPKEYAVDGSYLILRPIPDAVYAGRMKYYKTDDVLSTNIENDWLLYAADLLIAETGKIMAGKYTRDAEALATFTSDATEAWLRLQAMNESRKSVNNEQVMQYGSGVT